MVVINLFGGPGTGKSTVAAYIFAMLKQYGLNAEYVSEFAKDKTWEGSFVDEFGVVEVKHKAFECQPYLTAKQYWKQCRLRGCVDVVVTDSPMIVGLLYPTEGCGASWAESVVEQYNSFDNINIFLVRNNEVHSYNSRGRSQTLASAEELDERTLNIMREKMSTNMVTFTVDDLDLLWTRISHYINQVKPGLIPGDKRKWMI